MALHGEKLKMGKDVRGIERGKCAWGECEDFMWSDGATCGYCGCLPTCHSRKDARRLDYQPLFRENEPALMPEKTAGLVN